MLHQMSSDSINLQLEVMAKEDRSGLWDKIPNREHIFEGKAMLDCCGISLLCLFLFHSCTILSMPAYNVRPGCTTLVGLTEVPRRPIAILWLPSYHNLCIAN